MGLLSKLFGPPSQDKFAKLILRRFKQAGVADQFRYVPNEFMLEGPRERKLMLGNAYAEYLRTPAADREQLLKRFLAAWAGLNHKPPEEFEDAKQDVFPVLRARSYFEVDIRRVNPEADVSQLPYSIIAEDLCVSLVYDLPASMMTVNQELLNKWGVSFYEAMEVAKANLRETTKRYAQIGSIYSVVHGDSYDASRLVLTDVIEGIEVSGEHIAMVPNRDTLLIAGSEDEQGLATMLALATEGIKHERFISGIALKLSDGEWEPWLPLQGHPLRNEFRELQLQTVLHDYNAQKEVLDAKLAREERDIFVASLTGVRKEATGEVHSYAVWSKNVPTLLPRCDYLVLVGPGPDGQVEQLASGAWDDVHRVAGHLMHRQDMYPERHLVESFPMAEELEQIGKADFV